MRNDLRQIFGTDPQKTIAFQRNCWDNRTFSNTSLESPTRKIMSTPSKLSVADKQRLGYYTPVVDIITPRSDCPIHMSISELRNYYGNLANFIYAKQKQFGIANVTRHIDHFTGRNVVTIRTTP